MRARAGQAPLTPAEKQRLLEGLAEIDERGAVSEAHMEGNLAPAFAKCVQEACEWTRFYPPEGGGATLVIPLTIFPPQPDLLQQATR